MYTNIHKDQVCMCAYECAKGLWFAQCNILLKPYLLEFYSLKWTVRSKSHLYFLIICNSCNKKFINLVLCHSGLSSYLQCWHPIWALASFWLLYFPFSSLSMVKKSNEDSPWVIGLFLSTWEIQINFLDPGVRYSSFIMVESTDEQSINQFLTFIHILYHSHSPPLFYISPVPCIFKFFI